MEGISIACPEATRWRCEHIEMPVINGLQTVLTDPAESVQYASWNSCGNSSVVEHNLAKVGVASSNLVSRSRKLRTPVTPGFSV